MAVSAVLFKQIKSRLSKTFTVDNGSEFAPFKTLEEATNSKLYFADPYLPYIVGLKKMLSHIIAPHHILLMSYRRLTGR